MLLRAAPAYRTETATAITPCRVCGAAVARAARIMKRAIRRSASLLIQLKSGFGRSFHVACSLPPVSVSTARSSTRRASSHGFGMRWMIASLSAVAPRENCRLIPVTEIKMIAVPHSVTSMHPPPFLVSHMLSAWAECSLEIYCERCERRRMTIAVKGLTSWYGNRTFAEVLSRLRCKYCRRSPAAVYLYASQAIAADEEPAAHWTLEIIPHRTDVSTRVMARSKPSANASASRSPRAV
jgi:hypothetical protein